MKLTRLELSGFKSFADTIDLPFEDGVTAIVGPNGCGKSNISDAVRWVLGEQRVSLLRGSKMDEVIFQGSAKRRPIGMAEVSLYLDNTDDSLALAYNEVVVTRRLSRSGQSEYLLNGSPVRLRDLNDLLQGTGLGSDVGVVIEAQMIDRLLSDRPDERRSLFEEAAGIGLYRDRKISTERRLGRTAEDLQRLDDLISEVQTQVRSLARQRGRAERHEKFMAERFNLVMSLTQRELTRIDDADARLRSQQQQLATEVPQLRDALRRLEQQREEQVQARAAAEMRRTELQRRLAETRVAIERLDGDLNLATERLTNAAARKARALEERQLAEERSSQADRERDAAAAERAAAASARESVQTELDLRSANEGEVRERLGKHRDLVRGTETGLQQLAEQVRTLAGERTAVEREVQDLQTHASEADQRRVAADRELEEARQHMATARTALEHAQREERTAVSELERARHTLAAAREREAALSVERRTAEEHMAQLSARREALEQLERAREGLAPGARSLLRHREQFGSGAILGPLTDYVSTSQLKAPLAERLLADWMHAVLVRDDDVVSAVKRWHGRADPGPLVLLPVSPGPLSPPHLTDMADVVVEAPADRWVRALLADAGKADDDGSAIHRPNGAVFLPSPGSVGPLARRAELESLRTELQESERHLDGLKQAAQRAADDHAHAERTVETASGTAERVRLALREMQGANDDAGRRLHRAEREKIESDEVRSRLLQRITERSARLQALGTELESSDQERARLTRDLEAHRATLEDLEAQQESAREHRVHWQVEEAQVSAREEAAREREARVEQTLAEARQVIATLDEELRAIDEANRDLSNKQAQWTDELAEKRLTVQELESAARSSDESVQHAESAVAETEVRVAGAREELEQLNERAHSIEIELTQSAGQRQALIERIEAEWHHPLAALLEKATVLEGGTEEMREEAESLARTIEALGPVNPLAVHEHAEELKRLQFLQEQREDLVEARKGLLQALREIDDTARAMFTETFSQIRENFHSVFRTLFEGGECDVRLVDEDDPLESAIEIVAAPRGKRTQRIHLLSSGERALVALSLLFSIYLTKPAPFCLLDEVDAPLDDANVTRFVHLLDEFKADTQFIVITHNPRTMQVADSVYGVTMQEPGVSTIVGVRLGQEAVAS